MISKNTLRSVFIALLYVTFISKVTFSQENKFSHTIQLKTGNIIPMSNIKGWTESMDVASKNTEPTQVLLHFNSIPTEEQKILLRKKGIILLDYIPENTYLAIVNLKDIENISNEYAKGGTVSNLLHSMINVEPKWKIDESLLNSIAGKNGDIEVLVTFFSSISSTDILQYIDKAGGRIHISTAQKYGNYKVIIPASKVYGLASWYGVKYISVVSEMAPCDIETRAAVRGNIAGASAQYGGYGLLGDSVTVGVGDNTAAIFHADLKDRIRNFCPVPMTRHGEHINGIIGGAANVDPFALGMAPHVSLIDYYFDLILPETRAMYNDFNMNITNNSYAVTLGSCTYSGTYDGYSQLLDSISIENPYVIHVFASGNDGYMTCSPFLPGYGTVAGGYQIAKNNIVVGSFNPALIEAYDESRGPTKDGRMKPEIIATGRDVYSTVNVDGYVTSAGTSMASPHVAGAMALLTQRYKQLNSNALPNSDLLKALALNGAVDLGNPGPDFSYGYGGMDVSRSLSMIDNSNYFRSLVASGDSQVFTIDVPAYTAQLKVLICWNDQPANPMSAKQLVNDIDLTVYDTNTHTIHYPLVLDPTPANVNNLAVEKPDHTNNVEQVTINNPSAGSFIVNIKGFKIVNGHQPYALAYDIVPMGVLLTFPNGGEQFSNKTGTGDSIRVFWDGITDTNSFTVKLTTDNGATWNTIDNNVPPNIKRCAFLAPNINSGNCFIKVSRNNTTEIETSGKFIINTQPVISLDSLQCPSYLNIHWSPIPNATSYVLLKKIGAYMQVVDSVTDTFYSFHNMSLSEKSYVSVSPVIDGFHGYRSMAAIAIANNGSCLNTVSNGDLMIEKVLAPKSGRVNTSLKLTNNETLKLQLRNLYSATCTNFTISYQINSGSWNTIFLSPYPLRADTISIVNIPGFDFSAIGTYSVTVALTNNQLTDPNTGNDTITYILQNLPNDTLSLSVAPFTDSFETMDVISVTNNSIGVSPNGHWDYFNNDDTGRLRTFVSDEITISGNRSISLDETRRVYAGSKNTFVGTFNLSNIDTTTEIRMDFDYILHGTPLTADGNMVLARASDTSAWSNIYSYNLSAYPGYLTNVRSLSLTDIVKNAKANFTSSTQISFCQSDTSLIAAKNYGNGITFDNFRLYTVTNDVQLVGILNPLPADCGLSGTVPVTVQVHNGVNHTLYNVSLQYNFDGGGIFTRTIDSIKGKDTLSFTFNQPLTVTLGQTHILNTWLASAGDSYKYNDSIMGYTFRVSKIVTSFPYLENFESGDGGYFADGYKSSWQYGTPIAQKVKRAASGTKAWKTNLTGNYNNLEKSYLYSPCFDISALNNPMLSFSAALDIENCGKALCDQAYVEYSFDDIIWQKLGGSGQGTNWYDSTFNIWNQQNFTRWHVASIPLPKPPTGNVLHLRFALAADPGTNFEGFAVDDIHIFDKTSSILNSNSLVETTLSLNGNTWYDFVASSQILASIQPKNNNLTNTTVTQYPHDSLGNPSGTQYAFPHSYNISTQSGFSGNVGLRLFLKEDELLNTIYDTTCPSCTKITDAYSLGISHYKNSAFPTLQNGTLIDDTGGKFTFYPSDSINWVPYDNGYYAEFNAPVNGEFWFNNGGPTNSYAVGSDYLDFYALKNNKKVVLYWNSLIDTLVTHYIIEKSIDGTTFFGLLDTTANHTTPAKYLIYDNIGSIATSILYYRLKWNMIGMQSVFYSPIRKVNLSDSTNGKFNFGAKQTNHTDVLLSWHSDIDVFVTKYLLEKEINNNGFEPLSTITSNMINFKTYTYTDKPTERMELPNATFIKYRLSAFLVDGSIVVMPVENIKWLNNNSLVQVYPNPIFDGNFTMIYYADSGTDIKIHITDIIGKTVFEAKTTANNWINTTTFSTFTHPRGIYFVRIKIGDKVYMRKLEWE